MPTRNVRTTPNAEIKNKHIRYKRYTNAYRIYYIYGLKHIGINIILRTHQHTDSFSNYSVHLTERNKQSDLFSLSRLAMKKKCANVEVLTTDDITVILQTNTPLKEIYFHLKKHQFIRF